MDKRQEAEATMAAAGINLEGREYREIPDPEGDGVTRVWAKPGGILDGIIDQVIGQASSERAKRKDVEIDFGPIRKSKKVVGLKTKHDASFAKGWNDVANVSRWYESGFDPDKYLAGVLAAVKEWKRAEDKRAKLIEENAAEIRLAKRVIAALEKEGIFAEQCRDGFEFTTAQGIENIEGEATPYDSDVPF